jgi:hypothetical protein
MSPHHFSPYRMDSLPEEEMLRRGQDLLQELSGRRTVRQFSPRPVPRACVELAIRTAATSPSGANRQPWCFVP